MPVLSARNLSKAYGARPLFANISLTVRTGERVGLIGANGTGKSTLLRVLAGEEPADEGVIDRRREASILYLPQEPVLDPAATPRALVTEGLAAWHVAVARHTEVSRAIEAGGGADLLTEQAHLAETIEHLGGWTRGHQVEEMLDKLGVREPDRPVETMSGGEKRRVALARLLVARPTLAILDEPTNHLDADTIEWLEEYLVETFPGAVLVVTHDRYVLDAISDRVVELDGGALTEYTGGYGDYLEQKAERLAHADRVEQNRLNLVRREQAWLMRGAKARSTKQKARIQRAEAIMAVEPPKAPSRVALEGLEAGAARTGKTVLDLVDLSLDLGGRRLIDSLTLRMVGGDRIGIVGPNGAGKTSLLRIAHGESTPTSGEANRGSNTKSILFDQARAGLEDDWSIFDNVAEREGAERTGAGVVKIGDRTLELRTYLEQFLFEGHKQRQKVGSLSGGERARVALAKALKLGANLLLLDEPTNDLDVATLSALEELLETWPGSMLVVSHDRYFLNRVATSILAFERDGKVVRYPGNYDAYRAARSANAAPPTAAIQASPPVQAAPTPPPVTTTTLKPLTYGERLELEKILDRIGEAETRASTLEKELADPSLYTSRPERAKTLQSDHAKALEEVAQLTARWEELESRRDAKK